MKIDKIDDLCMWKDLFYLLEDGATTFDGYEKWNDKHPLYKCIDCGGYDAVCNGYKSLRSINRNKDK